MSQMTVLAEVQPTIGVPDLEEDYTCATRLGDFHPLGSDSEDDYSIAEADDVTVAMIVESSPQQTFSS